MRRALLLTAATLAAVVLSGIVDAAQPPHDVPKKLPSPVASATPEATPTPGTLVHEAVPGGWLQQVAGDPDHLLTEVPGYSPQTGRTLLVTAASSETFEKLVTTAATILGADGKTVHTESLRGYHSTSGDLSPDGKSAAVIAEPWEEGGNRAVLIGFTDAGKIWKRPAIQGDDLLVAKGYVAEITQPHAQASLGDLENDPPSPAAPTSKPDAVRFFHVDDGTPFKAPAPITGAVARAGENLVAVSDGKLHVYAPNLAQRAQAVLGFEEGFPAASADGSLILVADFTLDPAKKEKQVLLFDGSAKKIGVLTMPASVGIEATAAPDGSAVLATTATVGVNGPARSIETEKTIPVVLVDRTGKVRWKFNADRRTETEHAGSLSVSAGGKRAACAFFADDPDENPDRAMIFDDKGAVIYKVEGTFQAVWLDPTGEWLYTIEDEGISRLRVKDLVSGKAFPEAPDE